MVRKWWKFEQLSYQFPRLHFVPAASKEPEVHTSTSAKEDTKILEEHAYYDQKVNEETIEPNAEEQASSQIETTVQAKILPCGFFLKKCTLGRAICW